LVRSEKSQSYFSIEIQDGEYEKHKS
jgi:hypothetical protein